MAVMVVGEAERVRELIAGDRELEDARIHAPSDAPEAEESGGVAGLARELVEIEAEMIARQPQRVVLADDSDASLAAALVAAKLLVPLVAVAAATQPSGGNGPLISQLAEAYTRTP